MEIRVLLADDAPAWCRIRRESLIGEPLAFGKAVQEHDATPVEAISQRFRDAPADNLHLGAFDQGTLIGIATFIRDTGLKDRHKGHVYGVYVSPSHRGKGVGRAMLAYLLDRVRQDPSIEQILLAVGAGQEAAIGLYRSLGFQTFGTEPAALKIGPTYVDEHYMILWVHPRP